MDLMTVIGFILAVGLVVFGIVFVKPDEGQQFIWKEAIQFKNLGTFFDASSEAITIGGTFATLMIAFPGNTFKKVFAHLRILFFPSKYNPRQAIDMIVDLAKEARMKGLLSLEDKVSDSKDPFLKSAVMLVVDAIEPEKVKSLLEAELDFLDDRHGQDRAFYDKGAAFGPAFGMIGTLIGLILMLRDLDDPSKLGAGMSVALITTMYGSLLANIIFIPISTKLKVRHNEEYLYKLIICEGVQAIQSGENPRFIEEKLTKLLSGAYKTNAKKPADSDEDTVVGKPGKGRAAKDNKAPKGASGRESKSAR